MIERTCSTRTALIRVPKNMSGSYRIRFWRVDVNNFTGWSERSILSHSI